MDVKCAFSNHLFLQLQKIIENEFQKCGGQDRGQFLTTWFTPRGAVCP
jgi:hypothetical protein